MKTPWLGLIFFVALALLAVGTVGIGDMQLFGTPRSLRIGFPSIEGLKKGDDVRVNGLSKGKVAEVRPLREGEAGLFAQKEGDAPVRVHVHVRLDEDVVLHRGAKFKVETVAALGGMVLSIDAGDPKEPVLDFDQRHVGYAVAQPLAQLGDILNTQAGSMTDVVKNIAEIAKNLNEAFEGRKNLGEILAGPELYRKMLDVMDETQETMKALASGRSFGMDPESELRVKLDKSIGEADNAIAEMRKTFESLNSKEAGAAGLLINDPEFRAKLETAVTDAGDALKRVSEEISEVTKALREQKGAIGRAIYDEKMGEDLSASVASIRKSAENIEKITQDLIEGRGTIGKFLQDEEFYDKAKGVAEGADALLGRMSRTKVYFGTDYMHAVGKDYGIGTMFVEFWPTDDKFFRFGANIFDLDPSDDIMFKRQIKDGDDATQTAFTVLGGFRVPWFFDDHLIAYAGLLEGTAGAGFRVEWEIDGYPISATIEGRPSHSSFGGEDLDEEIDGPLLRSYVTAPLWKPGGDDFMSTIFGSIRMHAGINNILDEPELLVGAGVYFADQDLKTLVGLIGLSQ